MSSDDDAAQSPSVDETGPDPSRCFDEGRAGARSGRQCSTRSLCVGDGEAPSPPSHPPAAACVSRSHVRTPVARIRQTQCCAPLPRPSRLQKTSIECDVGGRGRREGGGPRDARALRRAAPGGDQRRAPRRERAHREPDRGELPLGVRHQRHGRAVLPDARDQGHAQERSSASTGWCRARSRPKTTSSSRAARTR